MQGVGFQSLTVVLVRDSAKSAGAPPVDDHREQHDGKCRDRGFDLYAAEEESQSGFIDDPGAGQKEKCGFDERREVLDFAVTVLMLGVGGFVGDANRKECQDRGCPSCPLSPLLQSSVR